MGKTFSCTFEGCDQVFPRQFQLKKHRATHDDPDSVHQCPHCEFFSLDPRNLVVHIAKHTGEKKYVCPDTIKVCEPSGSSVEERCEYRTNDRSLLTKHRKRVHKYVPRRRASPQRTEATTFIPYSVPSSPTTENTTSGVTNSKSKQARKRNATTKCSNSFRTDVTGEPQVSISAKREELDSSLPSTLQESVDEHGQMARVESPDATGSSSTGSSSAVPFFPNEHASLDVHGQQAYVGSTGATSTFSAGSGDTTLVAPNGGISSDVYGQSLDVDTSQAAGPSSSTLVASDQNIFAGVPFDPATDHEWSWLHTDDFARPSTSNFQTDINATGDFQTMIGYDGPDIMPWDVPVRDKFWAYHSLGTSI